ncbi:MAG: sulfotransferase domain-containing protein [Bacteroidales bacterium]|nr:sulfotransferase domain-containing protein [Bacteroidales bacterium]
MIKIISFLYNLTTRLSKNFKKAADDLYYLLYKYEFGEREDDIYIVSYPKSGTTLMQMLVYQLVTDGNMEFKHIYDVSPWTRNEAIRRQKPRNLESPRIIKTHDEYKEFDPDTKGKFIFIFRDGLDTIVSNYHQEKNYNYPDLELTNYAKEFIHKKKYNWFVFMKKWLQNKKKLPILYIKYENLLNDFVGCLDKIAGFLNYNVDESNKFRIQERCSFEYMKAHQEKFGDQPSENKKKYDQFIRKGKPGEGKETLNKELKDEFMIMFKKHLGFLH